MRIQISIKYIILEVYCVCVCVCASTRNSTSFPSWWKVGTPCGIVMIPQKTRGKKRHEIPFASPPLKKLIQSEFNSTNSIKLYNSIL